MKRMKGKILAILMSLSMAFTMMPTLAQSAYAGEHEDYDIETEYECNHDYTYKEHRNDIAPTCTEYGSYDIVELCRDCGDQVDAVTIRVDPTGHTFDQETVEENYLKNVATCTNPAEYYVSSRRCDASSKGAGDKEATFKNGDLLGHTWDAGTVTKASTEDVEGLKTHTCTVCNATKTETIPKLKPTTLKISGTSTAKVTTTKKSMTLGWNKIEGAEGYDIFFAECNHGGKKIVCKNVKTIEGNNIFTWTNSGLKKGTAYKSYVKAYVMKNGRKVYVSTSPVMHAYTGNGNKKYTNAKSVTIRNVKKGKLSLKKNKTFKIKAKVNKVNKGKKLMPKGHAPTLRYMTSDSKVATVNSKGKITAKGSGTCYITVFAHNGVSKSIKVTVP